MNERTFSMKSRVARREPGFCGEVSGRKGGAAKMGAGEIVTAPRAVNEDGNSSDGPRP